MSCDVAGTDLPARPWTIGRRLLISLYCLVAAAGLLGLTALGLALAWHLLDSNLAAVGFVGGILVLRWVGLYGLGALITAVTAPFMATSPYASTEATGDSRSSGRAGWYAEADVHDFADDVVD
ncbi:hypothetical protein ACQEVF_57905 [Nonomuraea polychroma]|uniref:hypothetical protein n=1 Tax=Nonomuraea polychroma TaxID=46176 RepID=UPI003D938A33